MKRRLIVLPLCLLFCLLLVTGAQAQVQSIRMKYVKATMTVGKSAKMPITVKPAAERANVTWTSSDEGVATVSQDGLIVARGPGVAVIKVKATGSGAASAQCRLTVKPAAVTGVTLNQTEVTALVGSDAVQLSVTLAPAAAAGSTIKWSTSNKKVVTVTSAGKVNLVGVGTATVTATAPSGKKAKCTFKVQAQAQKSSRRAIVIGESRARNIDGFQLTELTNVSTDLKAVASMLKSNGIPTTTVFNTTKTALFSTISSTLGGATQDDISYVYILCHGGYMYGNYRIFPCGNSYVSPYELRYALDKVPGKVVLMLGSCYAGSVISKSAEDNAEKDMAQAFIDAFKGATPKSGELIGEKYQIICAAAGSEEALGITSTYGGIIDPNNTYTFFGKALTEGGTGAADANNDKKITLGELNAYADRRVKELFNYWKSRTDMSKFEIQNVVCYPTGSSFVLF